MDVKPSRPRATNNAQFMAMGYLKRGRDTRAPVATLIGAVLCHNETAQDLTR